MRSITVEMTIVSGDDVAASIDYGDEAAPMVRRWRLDRSVLDRISADVYRISAQARREPLTDEETETIRKAAGEGLRSAGLALFQEIFKIEGDTLRRLASDEAGSWRLVYKIDRSLAGLPLEVMHDGSGFLSVRFAIGRLIYTDDTLRNTQPAAAPPATVRGSVLIVGDPSGDPVIRQDVEDEIDTIKAVFKRRHGFRLRIVTGPEADKAFFLAALPGSTVFHFSGHGETSEDERGNGMRLGNGKILSGYSIRGLQDPPVLAFLNMCTAASQHAWKTSLGLVEVLLRRGTRACVASLWDVRSKTASSLSARFYDLILDGMSFGEALRLARAETLKEYGAGDPTWAAYTLYGDPGLTLANGGPAVAGLRRHTLVAAATVGAVVVLASILVPAKIDRDEPTIPQPRQVGYILLESQPGDATIFIDGSEIGLTPQTAEVTVGNHRLVIFKQGYRRWEANVEAKKNERTEVKAELEPID